MLFDSNNLSQSRVTGYPLTSFNLSQRFCSLYAENQRPAVLTFFRISLILGLSLSY